VPLSPGWAARLGAAPIVNVHVVYDRPVLDGPFLAAVDSPVQWVFDRTGHSGCTLGQYLALSLSAAQDLVGLPAAEIQRRILPALAELVPRARSAEVLDIVLKLWASEGAFSYHGRFFDIETPVLDPATDRGYYMKPYQRPHPPIAVAASTPGSSSMRLAGARGWIPMSSSLLARPYLAGHWRLVEDAAAAAGRPAKRSDWRIARDILVGPTSAIARERARAVLGRNYLEHQRPNRLGTVQMTSTKLEPSLPDDAVTVDYLLDNVWIVGDPSECAEKIHQLHAESGGFGALLAITTDSDDAGWDHESLRLLADQVAPRIGHLG
jgi:alkanesulfonate monooxygenase SsuD/methylene tetrahydromethanopterin reductase-like flavin-dependent oxidoreductase (luciferase family)